MRLLNISKDYTYKGVSVVDNMFLSRYMPKAPAEYVKIYLYGIYILSSQNEEYNTITHFTNELNKSEQEITDAFSYFEDEGLIEITEKQPLKIKYLPITESTFKNKKIKPEKYSDFSLQIQKVLSERMITPNEFNEYYTFIETYNIEPNALVMIIKYCTDLKGVNVSYKYILTVAKAWITQGLTTAESITNELDNRAKKRNDIERILSALKTKRSVDDEDNELYIKWTRDFGFNIDSILLAVSILPDKKGGIKKLDSCLTDFYNHKAYTKEEMQNHLENKRTQRELAIRVNKELGVFYEVIDPVVTYYISPWLNMGFGEDTILLIANYCYRKNNRSHEAMDEILKSFYKQGIITAEATSAHIVNIISRDKIIKSILEEAGMLCTVNNWHRENYETWSVAWGIPDDVIKYAAARSCGKVNAVAYMNKILSNWKSKGILTLESAEKETENHSAESGNKSNVVYNSYKRTYSQEELANLIDDIDSIEF